MIRKNEGRRSVWPAVRAGRRGGKLAQALSRARLARLSADGMSDAGQDP